MHAAATAAAAGPPACCATVGLPACLPILWLQRGNRAASGAAAAQGCVAEAAAARGGQGQGVSREPGAAGWPFGPLRRRPRPTALVSPGPVAFCCQTVSGSVPTTMLTGSTMAWTSTPAASCSSLGCAATPPRQAVSCCGWENAGCMCTHNQQFAPHQFQCSRLQVPAGLPLCCPSPACS